MKPSDIALALEVAIAADQPIVVWGQPGVGKSQVAQQTAAALGYKLRDIRASLLDPVDLRGIPHVINERTHWAAPSFLPSNGDAKTLILLDELNRAPVMTQNGLFQLILDRALGEYTVPAETRFIACCNRVEDGGGVQRMPAALSNRFVHIELEPDLEDWSRWAARSGIEPAVIAFLRFRPDLLCQFDRAAKAFPMPRSWEFVSKVTAQKPGNGIEHALYCGAVGEGAAVEYSAFLRMWRELPSIDAILLSPATAPVPSGPATLFAVSAAIARRMTAQNMGRAIKYLNRLPAEYAVYGVQDAIRRDDNLKHSPEFTTWAIDNSAVIF
jgi:hypothetical protein